MRFPKEGRVIKRSELPVGVPKYKNHIYIYKDLEKGLFFSSRSVQGVVDHLEKLNKQYNPKFIAKIVDDDGSEAIVSNIKTINYKF